MEGTIDDVRASLGGVTAHRPALVARVAERGCNKPRDRRRFAGLGDFRERSG
jgi:hypothetical protein